MLLAAVDMLLIDASFCIRLTRQLYTHFAFEGNKEFFKRLIKRWLIDMGLMAQIALRTVYLCMQYVLFSVRLLFP